MHLYEVGFKTPKYVNSKNLNGIDMQMDKSIYYCENIGKGILKKGLR